MSKSRLLRVVCSFFVCTLFVFVSYGVNAVTIGGLDWLKLSDTAGQEYDEALTLNPGWRHATNAEVEDLFSIVFPNFVADGPAGIAANIFGGGYEGLEDEASSFEGLLGPSFTGSDVVFTHGVYRDESQVLRIMGSNINETQGISQVIGIEYTGGVFGPNPQNGIYLVRDPLDPPPAEIPQAVITVVTDVSNVSLQDPIELNGLMSSTPGGGNIASYMWELTSRPDTSGAQLNPLDAATTQFTPDVFGEYQVTLVVTNEEGVSSSPVTETITVGNDLKLDVNKEAGLAEFHFVQTHYFPSELVHGKSGKFKVTIDNGFADDQSIFVKIDYAIFNNGVPTVNSIEEQIILPGAEIASFHLPTSGPIIPLGDKLEAIVKIDSKNEVAEADEGNNSEFLDGLPIKVTRSFSILYKRVRDTGDLIFPSCGELTTVAQNSARFIEATYPISDSSFPIENIDCHTYTFPSYLLVFPTKLAEHFSQLQAMSKLSGHDALIAVVDNGFLDREYGLTATLGVTDKGTVSYVEKLDVQGTITAHELAHQFGWVTGPLECPIFDFSCRNSHFQTIPDAKGYWVQKNLEVSERDFMDDGHKQSELDAWVSQATFEYLFSKFKINPVDPPVILLNGFIFKDDTSLLKPWIRYDSVLDVELNNPGDYSIQYLDENGEQIAQTGFDPSFEPLPGSESKEELDYSILSLRIPDVVGTAKIVIKHGEIIVAQREFSSSSPEINIVSPNDGEVSARGDIINVNWESSDADGDEIFHTVLISDNNGVNWNPLALDLTENEFNFEVQQNIESNTLSIRVIASDGINTGEDISSIALDIESDVVDIDIKPGSDPNSVNPRSKGVIPVAVLGSTDFDATQIDYSTVTFGPDAASTVHDGHVEDVNDDGFRDMVLHFVIRETGIACEDTEASLTGETFGGRIIVGADSVNVLCVCDTNSDNVVDIIDIRAISLKRNQPSTGPDDPMDWDQNGVIDLLDARGCQLACTLPRCAVQ